MIVVPSNFQILKKFKEISIGPYKSELGVLHAFNYKVDGTR